MKLEVAQDTPAGEESAAHTGEQVPVGTIGQTVGLGNVIGLFDQLTVDLVSEWPQVLAGLQDALDDGHRVRHRLHLLQRVEYLHRLVLQAGVALLLLHCREQTQIPFGFRSTQAEIHEFTLLH